MNTVIEASPAPAAGQAPGPNGADLMARVFAGQQETALRWRTSTAAERIQRIRALRAAVLDHAEAIRAAAAADFRKPAAEVDLTEIFPVVAEANHAIRHLRRWMRPRKVAPSLMLLGTRGTIEQQPRGRCLIISPWNYPVNLTFCPLVLALAAGNTAILKPSEMTPHLSAVIRRIVEAVFKPTEVAIFEGEADVSRQLLDLPFDHVFFTGSPALGKVVMTAAARHLTSVTLELGGKSPAIIDAGADLAAAAANICWSKFLNNGQTCIAPDHIYVEQTVADAFERELTARIKAVFGEGSAQQMASPDLARVVNERHTLRLKALIDDARDRGARVACGGEVEPASHFVAPTLLADVPAEARINHEEIFGPVLPLRRFASLDEVAEQINRAPKPLALYIWCGDRQRARYLLARTTSGGACINNSVVHALHPRLPFGGVNNSGIGSTHGEFGFRAFSHARAVTDTRLALVQSFYPPYTHWMRRLIAFAIRYLA
ncbi:MAG: aldehyde dehydrogenase family protein [Pseudomonadota bacterium]